MRWLFALIWCSASTLVVAAAPANPVKASNSQTVLAADDGRTLYVFDDDERGNSKCVGECLKLWPPFLAADGGQADGDWAILTRNSGEAQWAYKGRPLYFFARDGKSGDIQGASFNGNKWHAAAP